MRRLGTGRLALADEWPGAAFLSISLASALMAGAACYWRRRSVPSPAPLLERLWALRLLALELNEHGRMPADTRVPTVRLGGDRKRLDGLFNGKCVDCRCGWCPEEALWPLTGPAVRTYS